MTDERVMQVVLQSSRPQFRLRRIFLTPPVLALASPIFLLLLWELLVRTGALDSRFFPAPSSVVATLVEMLRSGELLNHAGASISRVLIGFALGAIPGVLLGIAMGLSPLLRAFLHPAIAAIYPIPKIALFPLIMLLLGLGETSKWAIVALAVFFQVLFSTLAGVMSIEQIYHDVARNFGASRWQTWCTVALPGALPMIFTGFQLGLGMALIVVVIAENFGTDQGLGFMIWRAWQIFEVRDMFVGLLMVALLGFLTQLGLARLERLLLRWRPSRGIAVNP